MTSASRCNYVQVVDLWTVTSRDLSNEYANFINIMCVLISIIGAVVERW